MGSKRLSDRTMLGEIFDVTKPEGEDNVVCVVYSSEEHAVEIARFLERRYGVRGENNV